MYFSKIEKPFIAIALSAEDRMAAINNKSKIEVTMRLSGQDEDQWVTMPDLSTKESDIYPIALDISEDDTLVALGSDQKLYWWSLEFRNLPPKTGGWVEISPNQNYRATNVSVGGINQIYYLNLTGAVCRRFGPGAYGATRISQSPFGKEISAASDGSVFMVSKLGKTNGRLLAIREDMDDTLLSNKHMDVGHVSAGSANSCWFTFRYKGAQHLAQYNGFYDIDLKKPIWQDYSADAQGWTHEAITDEIIYLNAANNDKVVMITRGKPVHGVPSTAYTVWKSVPRGVEVPKMEIPAENKMTVNPRPLRAEDITHEVPEKEDVPT